MTLWSPISFLPSACSFCKQLRRHRLSPATHHPTNPTQSNLLSPMPCPPLGFTTGACKAKGTGVVHVWLHTPFCMGISLKTMCINTLANATRSPQADALFLCCGCLADSPPVAMGCLMCSKTHALLGCL